MIFNKDEIPCLKIESIKEKGTANGSSPINQTKKEYFEFVVEPIS